MAAIRSIHDHVRTMARSLSGRRAMTIWLAGIVLLAAIDLVLTVRVAQTHGLLEVNPIARILAAGLGLVGIVLFKVLTVGLGVAILARARAARLAPIAAALALVVHAWMITQWGGYFDAMAEAQAHGHPLLLEGHQLAIRL